MTKSKSLLVTRNNLCLAIKTILAKVINLLIHVGSCLFGMVGGGDENVLSIKGHLHGDTNNCDIPGNTRQYRNLYTILNNIDVYEEQVGRTKKIPHCAVKFEAGKENRIGTKVCTD